MRGINHDRLSVATCGRLHKNINPQRQDDQHQRISSQVHSDSPRLGPPFFLQSDGLSIETLFSIRKDQRELRRELDSGIVKRPTPTNSSFPAWLSRRSDSVTSPKVSGSSTATSSAVALTPAPFSKNQSYTRSSILARSSDWYISRNRI